MLMGKKVVEVWFCVRKVWDEEQTMLMVVAAFLFLCFTLHERANKKSFIVRVFDLNMRLN